MENYKILSQQQVDLLKRPLPNEAVTPHPTKKFLSSIKSIYVTERLNDVFGVGQWRVKCEIIENTDKMIVVKALFSVPDYGIEYECYGGNDNADRGDAYKGATTDALTKIGSWLGIGSEVFKGQHPSQGRATATTQPRKKVTDANFDNREQCDEFVKWAQREYNKATDKSAFNAGELLAKVYDVTDDVKVRFNEIFKHHLLTKK